MTQMATKSTSELTTKSPIKWTNKSMTQSTA